MSNIVDIIGKIFAVYNLALIIAAITLNPMVLFICVKSKTLRSTSTFKLLAFNSINDMLTCIAWNWENFAYTFFGLLLGTKNLAYCRWVPTFFQYSTIELASWMLVSISLDRLLSLSFPRWRNHYFNGIKPVIYSSLLALFIFGMNFNEIFTVGYAYFENGTENINCFGNLPDDFPWYLTMSEILTYFGDLVPFGLLIILNALIIYKATRYSRAQGGGGGAGESSISDMQRNKRKTQMTKMILFITFLYIGMSLPGAILTGFFYDQVILLDYGQVIVNLINGIQFSFPAFNFFILFFSNKLFAQEIKSLFVELKFKNVNSSAVHERDMSQRRAL